MNKAVIYTDGSYCDHGGWSNVIFDTTRKLFPYIVYGTCEAKTSTHAETIACIRALDNSDLFAEYDLIEIRTDQSYIVDITSKLVNCRSMGEKFPSNNYGKYDEELQCIAYIQYQLGEKLRFRKAPANRFLRLAHNHAKAAAKSTPDNSIFYYKIEPQSEPISVHYHNISCSSLKKQYSNISDLTLFPNIFNDYDTNSCVNVRLSDISLTSKSHLEANHLRLSGDLARVISGEITLTPIIILQLENGEYELVSGFRSYCIAKIIDIEYIPSIIVNSRSKTDNNCA